MQLSIFNPEDNPEFPKLREYQNQVREETFNAIRAGYKRILIYAATGAGKTVIGGRLVYDAAITKNRKVLFIVHRDILIKQTLETFSRFGLNCGVIAGNYPENRIADVQIASIQTMSRRNWREWFKPDIVIADECHITAWGAPVMQIKPKLSPGEGMRGSCKIDHLLPYLKELGVEPPCTLVDVKKAYKEKAIAAHPDLNPNNQLATQKMQQINASWDFIQQYSRLLNEGDKRHKQQEIEGIYIGLTATPWRMSRREEMGDIFETIVCAPMPKDLIAQGHLVKPTYYGIRGADISKVRITDGDFNQQDLSVACNTAEVVEAAVREWKRLADGRLTIAFAVGVAHAKAIAQAFNEAGIPAASVDGGMAISDCDRIYKQLAAGEILVLASAEKLGEGFDVPAVSAIMLSRPTRSKAKYFQQLGRGLRPAPGKEDCIVIDQAGNVNRFGFVEDIKQVTLKRSGDDELGQAPVKLCPECNSLIYTFLMTCPHCGYEFPSNKDKISEIKKLELLLPREEVPRFKWYRRAIRGAFRNKNKRTPQEVAVAYKQQFKAGFPSSTWRLGAVFGDNPKSRDVIDYRDYLMCGLNNPNHPHSQKWIQEQLIMEFGKEFIEGVLNITA